MNAIVHKFLLAGEKLMPEMHLKQPGKFNKIKLYSPFTDNIWGADLADMKLILIQDLSFIKYLDCFCVLLTFIANIHGFFLSKIKKELQSLMLFKKSQMNQTAKQIKYREIKAVNFTIDQ